MECIFSPRVEAGWNSSAVALRVVRGDEKGTRCPGYTGPLSSGGEGGSEMKQ
jgi:hypothetical protein